MKKLMVVALMTVVMIGAFATNSPAANGLKQGAFAFGVNVDDDFVLTGRYFVAQDLAILALFGLGQHGGDSSGTDFGLGVGIRKYLSTEDFAPFFGGVINYRKSTREDDLKEASIMGIFGAEYFFEKRFSVEGNVGFGYTSTETTPGATTRRDTNLGTQRFGLSLNFYF